MRKICCIKPAEERVQGVAGASKAKWMVWAIQNTTGGGGIRSTRGGLGHPKLSWSDCYFFLLAFFLLSISCSPCFLMSSRVRTWSSCLSTKSKGSGGGNREKWAGDGLRGHLCCACVTRESQHVLEGWWHHSELSGQALALPAQHPKVTCRAWQCRCCGPSPAAGASQKGLEPHGGGHSSSFIEKRR